MRLLVDFAKYLIRNNCLLKFDYSPGCGKRSKVQKVVFREKYLHVKFLFHKILLFKGTKSKLPSNQFANLKGREPYLGLHSIFSVTARWWKKTSFLVAEKLNTTLVMNLLNVTWMNRVSENSTFSMTCKEPKTKTFF